MSLEKILPTEHMSRKLMVGNEALNCDEMIINNVCYSNDGHMQGSTGWEQTLVQVKR